jgi:hypothetical protein
MTWDNLLFMHWPVSANAIRDHVPASLEIDEHDGTAWVGVIPFGMSAVGPRNILLPQYFAKFLELNVRTYVKHGGKRGVYFFSLDAANPFAVETARIFFCLPYFNAHMRWSCTAAGIEYDHRRTDSRGAAIRFRGKYRPTGPVFSSEPGSLPEFLTERYVLFTTNKSGVVHAGEIHHVKWPLQPAEAEIEENTMLAPLNLPKLDSKPVLHYSEKLVTLAWRLRACD